jgi:hypothetical protein
MEPSLMTLIHFQKKKKKDLVYGSARYRLPHEKCSYVLSQDIV